MSKKPAWVKEAIDVIEFHNKKIREHGFAQSGRPLGKKEGWSVRDTARELGLTKSRCYDLIIIGAALKKNSMLQYNSYRAALSLAKKMGV